MNRKIESGNGLVRRSLRWAGLAAAPLALAASLQAAAVLTVPGSVSAGGTLSSGVVLPVTPSSANFAELPALVVSGFVFSGSQTYTFSPSSSGDGTLEYEISGTGTGTLDASSIPAHFDLTLFKTSAPGSDLTFGNWTLNFLINEVIVSSSSGANPDQGASANVTLTGWTLGTELTSWRVLFSAEIFNVTDTDSVFLEIPNNTTIQIDGVFHADEVPEPGTWLLAGAGLGILGLARRFRQKLSPTPR